MVWFVLGALSCVGFAHCRVLGLSVVGCWVCVAVFNLHHVCCLCFGSSVFMLSCDEATTRPARSIVLFFFVRLYAYVDANIQPCGRAALGMEMPKLETFAFLSLRVMRIFQTLQSKMLMLSARLDFVVSD